MNNTTPEKASDFVAFRIGAKINIYYPPLLVIVGTIGNVISLLVYIQKKYRSKAMGIYLSALSLLDTTMLWIGLFQYWLLFNFYPKALTEAHCHGMFFVVNVIGNISNWLIVILTIDRVGAVLFPLKYIKYSTTRKANIFLLILSIIAIIKNFHYLWTTDFVYNKKTGGAMCAFGIATKESWVTSYQWFETIISSLLPFFIILTGNMCIIIWLKKHNLKSKSMKESSRSMKPKGNNDRMTVMLLTVSFMFIVLSFPLLAFRLYFSNIDISKSARLQALYSLGHHICHKLWYTNYGINFFLYSIFGTTFRMEMKDLFRSKRSRVSTKYSTNNTQNTRV